MSLFRIEHIEVGDARLEARIRVLDSERIRTSAVPGVADGALALLPGLGRHSCENDVGKRFVYELSDTEVPHLLEHVAVELMALSGSPRTLRAETTWDFKRDGKGVFRVRVDFDDDLVAIAALRGASMIVEWLMGAEGERSVGAADASAPDVAAVVSGLRQLRGSGA